MTPVWDLTALFAAVLSADKTIARAAHVAFLLSRQNRDGGFSGREGGSDLYYTSFALRALDCLNALDEPLCRRVAGYLEMQLNQSASVVDLVSLLYCGALMRSRVGVDPLGRRGHDWPSAVASSLTTFRRPDGGYARTAQPTTPPALPARSASDGPASAELPPTSATATGSSTYHSFLVSLCYQIIDRPIPEPATLAAFIRSRRREDGGFVELNPMKRSGTNPTAAAVALLQQLDACDADLAAAAAAFLGTMQSPEGGLQANARAPLADLLSTFTGLLTLVDLQATAGLDLHAITQYVASLAQPHGGFRGGVWDGESDTEYTFYGLGATALLNALPA